MPVGKNVNVKISDNFGYKFLMTLVGILLVYGIVFLGTLIRNNLRQFDVIGKAERHERTITVSAEGRVAVKPDIAVTTMGMIIEAPTVAEAQQKNTTVMNQLIARLKAMGIEEKDIQTTNYNIYPQYNYTDNTGRQLTGYEVSQSVTIKIRDLTKANMVLALAGEVGANSVSGLQFTVDDPEVYKAEARQLALTSVKEKALSLSKDLGVRFAGVVSYDESEGAQPFGKLMYAEGMGGGVPPAVESGSNEVVVHVNVTFEIR